MHEIYQNIEALAAFGLRGGFNIDWPADLAKLEALTVALLESLRAYKVSEEPRGEPPPWPG
jgi:hypothetical protein